MAVQAFVFGNASALAAGQARHVAGAASAVLGVAQAVAMATSAPLASSGGAATAVPMICVMIVGVVGSLFAYLVIARPVADRSGRAFADRLSRPVVHRYLVVANHTLGGPQLIDAIRYRMSRGPAEFWVLAPATPTTHLVNDFNALSSAFPVDSDLVPSAADVQTRDQGIAEAQSNLDTELQRLRQFGATADGAVGDSDPMKSHRNHPRPTGRRRNPPLDAAAGHLPLARMGPSTSCPAQNQRSADCHNPQPPCLAKAGMSGWGRLSIWRAAPHQSHRVRRTQLRVQPLISPAIRSFIG